MNQGIIVSYHYQIAGTGDSHTGKITNAESISDDWVLSVIKYRANFWNAPIMPNTLVWAIRDTTNYDN